MEEPVGRKQAKETDDDVSLWARLPEDLIEAILAFLPAPSLIRVATVCKKWRSLLKSADFKLRCSRVPAHRPWLVIQVSTTEWQVYSPSDDLWYELPLLDLVFDGQLIAGAQGLLCFEEVMDPDCEELCLSVVDPISRHVTRLPSMDLCRQKSIALDVVEHSCPVIYRVVVLCYGGSGYTEPDMVTKIYDSHMGSWRVSTAEFPFEASIVLSHAVSGGNVYCLLANYLAGLQLVAYNIRGDSWTGINTEQVPSLVSSRVVGCQGEVMLVSWCENRAAGGIQVFRMDKHTRAWTELRELPNAGVISKTYRTGTRSCLAAGGFRGEFYLHLMRRSGGHWRGRLVRYEAERTWSTVECPATHRVSGDKFSRSSGVLENILCFEPRWLLHRHSSC